MFGNCAIIPGNHFSPAFLVPYVTSLMKGKFCCMISTVKEMEK